MFGREQLTFISDKLTCEHLKNKFGGKIRPTLPKKGNITFLNLIGSFTWYSNFICLADYCNTVKYLKTIQDKSISI